MPVCSLVQLSLISLAKDDILVLPCVVDSDLKYSIASLILVIGSWFRPGDCGPLGPEGLVWEVLIMDGSYQNSLAMRLSRCRNLEENQIAIDDENTSRKYFT